MWYLKYFSCGIEISLLLLTILRSEIIHGPFRLHWETSILMAEPNCFLARRRHRQRSSFAIANHRLAQDRRDHMISLDEKRFGSVLYWLYLPSWQSKSTTLLAMVRLYDHITPTQQWLACALFDQVFFGLFVPNTRVISSSSQ